MWILDGKTILLPTPALKCFMTMFTDQNTPAFHKSFCFTKWFLFHVWMWNFFDFCFMCECECFMCECETFCFTKWFSQNILFHKPLRLLACFLGASLHILIQTLICMRIAWNDNAACWESYQIESRSLATFSANLINCESSWSQWLIDK